MLNKICAIMFATAALIMLFSMDLCGSRIACPVQASDIQFPTTLTVEETPWIIPIYKKRVGGDIQWRINYLYRECIAQGMDYSQAKLVVGLADHESAGSWSPTIRGDNGLSVGIGQWYSGAGRYAPPDFRGQAKQLCDEMKYKFDTYSTELAIVAHNHPSAAQRGTVTKYYYKVLKSSQQF